MTIFVAAAVAPTIRNGSRHMGKTVTIVGFGDSITEATTQMPDKNKRWLNVLKSKLEIDFPESVFNVINSGIGGNSAREAMFRFEKDVLAHDPDWVLLEFGGNNNDPKNPDRRVDIDEFLKHLESFRLGISNHTKVIVITFPPIIDEQHIYFGMDYFKQFGGLDAAVEPYREATRKFASENDYQLVDLCREMKLSMESGKNIYTLPDGVHLTKEGNRLLAEVVFDLLRKRI
jgi:lysophospholipase L1-like esterase